MVKYFAVISVFLILSCAKKKNCVDGGLNISFINLLEGQSDTLCIKSYKKGTNLSQIVSEKTYVLESSMDSINGIINGRLNLSGNTSSFLSMETNNVGFLSSFYDYLLVLNGEEFFLYGMATLKNTIKCGGILSMECPTCYNPVISFVQDSLEYEVLPNSLHVVNE